MCPSEFGQLTHLMGGWVHLCPPLQVGHLWLAVRWEPAQTAQWGVVGHLDWWWPRPLQLRHWVVGPEGKYSARRHILLNSIRLLRPREAPEYEPGKERTMEE